MGDSRGREKAKRTWMLLIAAVLAAIVLWAAGRFARGDGSATEGQPDGIEVASTTGASSSAVSDYARFAETDAEPQPEYLADGLRRLAGAVGALGLGTPDLAVNLRVTAEHVLLNPDALETSSTVRNALMQVASAIAEQNPAAGDSLRRTVESLDARSPLAGQHAMVQQFFRQSGDAIEQLARAQDGS